MIASRQIIDGNPEAVRGAVQAVAKAWRDAARDQRPMIDALVKRNNLAKREVDLERLQFIIKNQVVSPFTQANGIGAVDAEEARRQSAAGRRRVQSSEHSVARRHL